MLANFILLRRETRTDYGGLASSSLEKRLNTEKQTKCLPTKFWSYQNLMTYFTDEAGKQNREIEGYIIPLPKKGDLGISKNYKGIILTPVAS